MKTLKEVISSSRTLLESCHLPPQRIKEELSVIAKRHIVSRAARKAFQNGIPIDQGPVWFGDDAWKTEHWKRQWEWQKAYTEGEEARARFEDRDNNPYEQIQLPFSSKLIELESCWNKGFNNEVM